MSDNALYFGDNLAVLRESVRDESIDLIYLDPPFNSQANYNVLFRAPTGEQSHAQIEAFGDTWHWGESAEHAFDEVMRGPSTDAAELLRSLRSFLKENDMMAYLTMLAVRLLELHRVLKPTGSPYLHCDPTASHYLKFVLDGIFGVANYRSEINWRRASAHSDAKQGRKQYGNVRDVIFFYTKGSDWNWNWLYTKYDESYVGQFYRQIDPANGRRFQADNLTAAKPGGDTSYEWRVKRSVGGNWQSDLDEEWNKPHEGWEYLGIPPYRGRYWAYSKAKMREFADQDRLVYSASGTPRYKRYLDEMPGVPLQNDWQDIQPAFGGEDLGYPTQKPLSLLERIISASSKEGDLVLDPFCGCGTTIHAAQKLKRHWIGIDVTHLAISLIEKRLNDAFPGIQYEVHGTPKDFEGAKDLANRDKYQFQWWAVSLVNAVPFGGKRKGADTGIDGIIYFKDFKDGKPTTEKIIVSVKGGGTVSVPMIRDLAHVVEREGAKMGLFVTLTPPTDPMNKEALKAGYYLAPNGKDQYRKLQIATVADLLDGKKPDLPPQDPSSFGQAAREESSEQLPLIESVRAASYTSRRANKRK